MYRIMEDKKPFYNCSLTKLFNWHLITMLIIFTDDLFTGLITMRFKMSCLYYFYGVLLQWQLYQEIPICIASFWNRISCITNNAFKVIITYWMMTGYWWDTDICRHLSFEKDRQLRVQLELFKHIADSKGNPPLCSFSYYRAAWALIYRRSAN